ncbi:MAG: 16S rRNA (guanine(966)-N(2))-methyltransferase RsmD [Candidatus Omnitrophota bacterium]|nr:16S rRNA (guanine(966)-N(2))-methyltransferase RsmD [Candidatus Omnitrophota bacterium]
MNGKRNEEMSIEDETVFINMVQEMTMRVIGGEYRSRLIAMPKGAVIRPTQDKVRESIFNILQDVSGKMVLELFAGSGALGIEAISRGATHATFIDNNSKCIEAIKANLKSLAMDNCQYDILRADALRALPNIKKEGKNFDLVFMDPPYYKGTTKKCLILIDSYDILSRIGLVVVEHHRKDDLPLDLKTIKIEKVRRYGDTVITIFHKIL